MPDLEPSIREFRAWTVVLLAQGILSCPAKEGRSPEDVAEQAITYADAILSRLELTTPPVTTATRK